VQAEDSDGLFTVFTQFRSGYWHLYVLAEKTGRVVPVDDLILGYVSKFLPGLECSLVDLGVEPPSKQDVDAYRVSLNLLFIGVISELLTEDDNFFICRIRPLKIIHFCRSQQNPYILHQLLL
jgi:hypothetical protein